MSCQSALFLRLMLTEEVEQEEVDLELARALVQLTPESAQAVVLEMPKVSASESPETAMVNLSTVGINNLHRHVVL